MSQQSKLNQALSYKKEKRKKNLSGFTLQPNGGKEEEVEVGGRSTHLILWWMCTHVRPLRNIKIQTTHTSIAGDLSYTNAFTRAQSIHSGLYLSIVYGNKTTTTYKWVCLRLDNDSWRSGPATDHSVATEKPSQWARPDMEGPSSTLTEKGHRTVCVEWLFFVQKQSQKKEIRPKQNQRSKLTSASVTHV